MPMNTLDGLTAAIAILAGWGALWLALAGLELLAAGVARLRRRYSPTAARQARVRAVLAAYGARRAAPGADRPGEDR